MKKASKKAVEKPKDDLVSARKAPDEKLTRSYSNISTPRNHAQKTADLYTQTKKPQVNTAVKKKPVSSTTFVSPMKDLLKSSPSAISQTGSSARSIEKKTKQQNTLLKKNVELKRSPPKAVKPLPFTNVTVKSPIVKKKKNKAAVDMSKGQPKEEESRQRKSTRTLNDDEVKVLTDGVDNNVEMKNLSKKLSAKPKAFFVDLGSGDAKQPEAKADERGSNSSSEVSYEDDFESYESDFESYKSSEGNSSEAPGLDDDELKQEARDEENMLDSGNFELREAQKSATKYNPVNMDFIREDSELDKKISLTDEGFQDMSNSSGVASIKSTHVDVLDRPLFIDFKKCKENKKRRQTLERQQQRAKDLLGMITLHEMSYSLFEMKPIPYDLYMATFGRTNYTQTAVQTFEDGISQEVQTEEVFSSTKWTQFPVEFSTNDVHLSAGCAAFERPKSSEEYLKKFTFMLTHKQLDVKENKNVSNEYKNNPLRIYFEQKDGVGTDKMLAIENYQSKIKDTKYSIDKLRKFLKKNEGRVSNILTKNYGNTGLDLTQSSYLPFSNGYISLDYKNIPEFKFLKYRKISRMVFSDSKTNFLMTVHKKPTNTNSMEKCLICLWDISIASRKPMKILVAIEDISICRLRGSTDGIFVSAMDDGSIHLWDLSEQAGILKGVASDKKPTELVEFNTEGLTQIEIDREWNLRNSSNDYDDEEIPHLLQACAYTSSALNMEATETIDTIVGLELMGNDHAGYIQDGGRKIVGQVCSLQRMGVLTVWLIVQEKTKRNEKDLGKAYWSKMKMEKNQTISLIKHIDVPILNKAEKEFSSFNLTAAKRRLASKKQEISRVKSAINSDRPSSVARLKKKQVLPDNWESGMLCTDLKVLNHAKIDYYLVAKNCGEILCCTRTAGAVKVKRFCVTTDMSTITSLSTSSGLPYLLAGTDVGSLHLCSLLEGRALLTLDCRNILPSHESEKYEADLKGRFLGTVAVKPAHFQQQLEANQSPITSIQWSATNPCAFIPVDVEGVSLCDLTYGDLRPRHRATRIATHIAHNQLYMALLRPDEELHVHRLFNEQKNMNHKDLFEKYVTLL